MTLTLFLLLSITCCPREGDCFNKSTPVGTTAEVTGRPNVMRTTEPATACGSPGSPISYYYQEWGWISSPNYPNDYPNAIECGWLISQHYDKIVGIYFYAFCLGYHDYVRVYDGKTTSDRQIATLSGCYTPGSVHSSGRHMLITFTTNYSGVGRGFRLRWHTNYRVPDSTAPSPSTITTREDISTGFPITAPFNACGSPRNPVRYYYQASGLISSPNYPDNYPNAVECGWLITQQYNKIVGIDFYTFCLEYHDYVRVYDGMTTSNRRIVKLTGCSRPGTVHSTGRHMLITFTTNYGGVRKGFRLHWHTNYLAATSTPWVDRTREQTTIAPGNECGSSSHPVDIRNQHFGSIASPSYPNNYHNYQDCAWRITGNVNSFVGINFEDFCLEGCCDYVRVYNGTTTSAGLIASRNGCSNPGSFNSTGRHILITFTTDHSVVRRGFNLTWQTYDKGCGSLSNPVEIRNQQSGWLASPLYPNKYRNNHDCAWRITGDDNTFVGIQFHDFCSESSYDFVRIYNGATKSEGLIASRSGCSNNPGSFNSTGKHLLITFTTDRSVVYRGFNLTWQFYDKGCGSSSNPVEIHNQHSGWISSPFYPRNYPDGSNCAWRITGEYNTFVGIHFNDFCLENCCDYVRIYDGTTTSHRRIASWNGCSTPGSIHSTGRQLLITFTTNYSFRRRGFNLTWQIYDHDRYRTTSPVPSSSPWKVRSTGFPSTIPVTGCGSSSNPVQINNVHSGRIASPYYPNNYQSNSDCAWIITGDENTFVGVHFQDICLESCCDYVRLYDGTTSTSRLIASRSGCSNSTQFWLNSTGKHLLITFTTDLSVVLRGFNLTWQTYNKGVREELHNEDNFRLLFGVGLAGWALFFITATGFVVLLLRRKCNAKNGSDPFRFQRLNEPENPYATQDTRTRCETPFTIAQLVEQGGGAYENAYSQEGPVGLANAHGQELTRPQNMDE